MKTPILFTGSSSSNVSNSADRYAIFAGTGPNNAAWTTLSGGYIACAVKMPCAGTISTLRATFPTVLTQGTYTLTLFKGTTQNGMSATALTVTIGTSSTSANDLVNSVSVSEGDYVAWKVAPSGTPTAQTKSVQIACMFDATTSGHSAWFSFVASGTVAGNVAPGCGAPPGATEAATTVIMPTGGTITKIYATLNANSGAPGTGNTRVVTLRKGTVGSLSDTTLTVTFGATDTAKSLDLGGSPVSVSAGDALSIAMAITGTPAASTLSVGIEFIPTTSGQAVLFGPFPGSLSTSLTRYGVISGHNLTAEADETNTGQLIPADLTIKNLYHNTATTPGASKSRTATLRKNNADTALVAAISGAGPVSATATTDVSYTAGDTIGVSMAPASTPAASAWSAVSAVAVVSTTPPAINFTPSDVAGQTFEGIRNTSVVQIGGAYSGTPTLVQVRLVDGSGTQVSAWATASSATGGVYSHSFSGVAVGGPYYHEVRDNGGTSTASSADLYVGAVVVLWGQSQAEKLYTDDTSGLTPSNGMQVRIMSYSSYNNVSTASTTITKYTSSTTGLAGKTGSGVVAIAQQWHADTGGTIPLLIVACAYNGTSIEYWTSDRKGDYPTNADTTTLWGTTPTTGFAWFMAAAAKYQASAVIFMQGTADVNQTANVASSGHDYAWFMDTLKTKFESLYNALAVAPLFLVVPHQRSDDGNNTFTMRQMQYTKAVSGGTWKLCCWLLDWQLAADGSPHQTTGATGNIRGGTRIGRGLARWLYSTSLDIYGPQIASAIYSNGTRTQIDVTFDRNISLADGTAYAGSPVSIPAQFNVSTDSGSTFTTLAAPDHTTQLVSATTVRLTKNSGSWSTGVRLDYLRGTPYASDAATADYVGVESSMESAYLAKVITDTTSFDSSRGMPASPVMGTGYAVVGTLYGPFSLSVTDAVAANAALPAFTILVS